MRLDRPRQLVACRDSVSIYTDHTRIGCTHLMAKNRIIRVRRCRLCGVVDRSGYSHRRYNEALESLRIHVSMHTMRFGVVLTVSLQIIFQWFIPAIIESNMYLAIKSRFRNRFLQWANFDLGHSPPNRGPCGFGHELISL